MLSTYYHRDEKNDEYLRRYNDSFPMNSEVANRLQTTFSFIDQCSFDEDSRSWKKTDLFTLLTELDSALNVRKLPLDSKLLGDRLKALYAQVDQLFKLGEGAKPDAEVFKYLKAATKATNDRYARIDRAEVVSKIIESTLSPNSQDSAAPKKRSRGKSS